MSGVHLTRFVLRRIVYDLCSSIRPNVIILLYRTVRGESDSQALAAHDIIRRVHARADNILIINTRTQTTIICARPLRSIDICTYNVYNNMFDSACTIVVECKNFQDREPRSKFTFDLTKIKSCEHNARVHGTP